MVERHSVRMHLNKIINSVVFVFYVYLIKKKSGYKLKTGLYFRKIEILGFGKLFDTMSSLHPDVIWFISCYGCVSDLKKSAQNVFG